MIRISLVLTLVLLSSCAAKQKVQPPPTRAPLPPTAERSPPPKAPVLVVVPAPDEKVAPKIQQPVDPNAGLSDEDENKMETPKPQRYGKSYKGKASYYHDGLIGRLTANGERYRAERATCAHKKLPFGTRVEVRALETQARVNCRVNDRGPFVKGRIIDLSKSLAKELGMMKKGVIDVEVRVLLED